MNNFRKLRKASKLTVKQAAKAVGVSYQAMYFWERGVHMPSQRSVELLSKFYNVTPGYLLGKEELKVEKKEEKKPEKFERNYHFEFDFSFGSGLWYIIMMAVLLTSLYFTFR